MATKSPKSLLLRYLSSSNSSYPNAASTLLACTRAMKTCGTRAVYEFSQTFGQNGATDANSQVSTRPDVKEEQNKGPSKELINEARDIYRQFTEGDIPCKHIYEEMYLTEVTNPYTSDGHEKLQCVEHQIKVAIGFLESKTSSKNLKQLVGAKDDSGIATWLNAFLKSAQACEKASSGMRSTKWETKAQLQGCGNTLSALIDCRKAFCARANMLNPTVITETIFDGKKKEIHTLGEQTPQRMQMICMDALM